MKKVNINDFCIHPTEDVRKIPTKVFINKKEVNAFLVEKYCPDCGKVIYSCVELL